VAKGRLGRVAERRKDLTAVQVACGAVFLLGFLGGVASLYLASIGAWPVSTLGGVKVLVGLFLVCLNAVAAGWLVHATDRLRLLLVAARSDERLEHPGRRVALHAASVGFAALVVALDLKVHDLLGLAPWAVLGAVVGVALALVDVTRLAPARAERSEHDGGVQPAPSVAERLGVPLLFGAAGVTAGGLVIALLVGITTISEANEEPPVDRNIPLLAAQQGAYVALGDSYSAGEGLEPFNHNTAGIDDAQPESNACHRSQRAYSQVVEFRGPEPAERFVACSGAVIHDIYSGYVLRPEQADEDINAEVDGLEDGEFDGRRVHPQVQPDVVDPDVELVTVTIGGNDMLFSQLVRFCIEHSDCLHADFVADAESERNLDYPDEPMPLDEWLTSTMVQVGDEYEVLYPRLADSFPNARIVVVGYPYLFPEEPAGWLPHECTTLLRWVSEGERAQIRERADDFNAVIEQQALDAGLEYVSPVEAWDGHEPCGPDGQLTNAINPLSPGGSFHPSEAGQHVLADLVATYLEEAPEPPEDLSEVPEEVDIDADEAS
jgi:hypothetical protein